MAMHPELKKLFRHLLPWCLLTLILATQTACAPLLAGGVAAGAAVVHDRRDTDTVATDQKIFLAAQRIKGDHPRFREQANISVDPYNRSVLLTGQADNREVLDDFVARVQAIEGVSRIINEVQVTEQDSLWDESADVYLASRAKLALLDVDLEGFDPTRVKIVVTRNVVYLMGLVTEQEGHLATEQVRQVPDITKVVKLFEYIQPE